MPQPDHLICLDIPDAENLGEDMDAYLAKCEEKLGMVPNVLRAYAKHPAKLRNFVQTYNTLMLAPSGLSKLEREMVAVVVSSANRCYYCLVAHGQAVRALSGDPQLAEMLVMNHKVAELPPRERAIVDFAWTLTTAPMSVGEAERNALRTQGLTDADIFDLADVAAFFNYTNRVAHATEMMPNPEYHAMNR
ncbi:peroxidase-related enzyme [Rhodospirillum sp. A1_3_36]|uniref:peroxidase-related enzyme n=1 Tax=Rhodospirillum sp. A1_3_36 TaxID=3391666 RepID=UPI0039A5B9A2